MHITFVQSLCSCYFIFFVFFVLIPLKASYQSLDILESSRSTPYLLLLGFWASAILFVQVSMHFQRGTSRDFQEVTYNRNVHRFLSEIIHPSFFFFLCNCLLLPPPILCTNQYMSSSGGKGFFFYIFFCLSWVFCCFYAL